MSSAPQRPTPLEAVRLALAELGQAPDEELALFIQRQYGLRMPPLYLPVARASLKGLEHLQASRKEAQQLVAQALAEAEPKKRRAPRSTAPSPVTAPPPDGQGL